MPNLFLSGLFIGFVLILGEIAIKAILWTILALWLIAGTLVALVYIGFMSSEQSIVVNLQQFEH